MMKSIILIGQTNTGKTLFLINFAEYLGMSTLNLSFQSAKKGSSTKAMALPEARSLLVSNQHHHTLNIQSTVLNLAWGKGQKTIEMIDTAGLTEGIHHQPEIRHAMALTLAWLRKSDIILHMVDTVKVAKTNVLEGIGEIDFQIARFGQTRSGYLILANKNDLPEAEGGLQKITAEFPGNKVIAISALKHTGFREVRTFVKQQL